MVAMCLASMQHGQAPVRPRAGQGHRADRGQAPVRPRAGQGHRADRGRDDQRGRAAGWRQPSGRRSRAKPDTIARLSSGLSALVQHRNTNSLISHSSVLMPLIRANKCLLSSPSVVRIDIRPSLRRAGEKRHRAGTDAVGQHLAGTNVLPSKNADHGIFSVAAPHSTPCAACQDCARRGFGAAHRNCRSRRAGGRTDGQRGQPVLIGCPLKHT